MKYEQPYENHYQSPLWACDLMITLIPDGITTVLEPTPGEGNLVRKLRERGYEVTAPVLYEHISPFDRFDAVVMNPPFLNSIEHKFLDSAMEMSDVVIALLPWFTLINCDSRTAKLKRFGIHTIIHLPRSSFKKIRVQTMILKLVRGYQGQINFHIFDKHLIRKYNEHKNYQNQV